MTRSQEWLRVDRGAVIVWTSQRPSFGSALASLALLISIPACPLGVEAADSEELRASSGGGAGPPVDGTLLHLEGRFGSPDALWVVASYKVKREQARLSKELEVKVEGARAGKHSVTVDGFEVGKLVIDSKGEGEFVLVEAGDDFFPEDFSEPGAGSLVRVHDLAELRLERLEKLTNLKAEIAGPGRLIGKVGFKVEEWRGSVTKEFKVKVAHAPESTRHAVRLDGVHVGDLAVGLGGKGKLKFSTQEDLPFPAGFPEPRVGSAIEIEGLFAGHLREVPAIHENSN